MSCAKHEICRARALLPCATASRLPCEYINIFNRLKTEHSSKYDNEALVRNEDLLLVTGTLYCKCCLFAIMRLNKVGSQSLLGISEAANVATNTPQKKTIMMLRLPFFFSLHSGTTERKKREKETVTVQYCRNYGFNRESEREEFPTSGTLCLKNFSGTVFKNGHLCFVRPCTVCDDGRRQDTVDPSDANRLPEAARIWK